MTGLVSALNTGQVGEEGLSGERVSRRWGGWLEIQEASLKKVTHAAQGQVIKYIDNHITLFQKEKC